MAYLPVFFLLLLSLFQKSQASPAHFPRWSNSTSASTLVSDTSLWTLPTPTTISSTGSPSPSPFKASSSPSSSSYKTPSSSSSVRGSTTSSVPLRSPTTSSTISGALSLSSVTGPGVSTRQSSSPSSPTPLSSSSSPSSLGAGVSSSSAAAPYSGSWSASPTEPTEAFPTYEAPTTTITGAAATSQAADLSGLFFAIYANRQWITDPKRKSEYIKDVKKTQDEAHALFNSLDDKPDPDAECSNTKRKRSLISGLTDLVGDAAKLISCATKVADNLVEAVEAPDPPISEIETLTDTLNEIGEDLQKEENNPSNSASQSDASSTSPSSSTSPTSCTASTAVPHCTETISLSTSFFSGATASSTVATITTTACTTVTACDASATTATTTVSATTSSGGIVCATDCAACVNPATRKVRRAEPLVERSLENPDYFDSKDQYVMEQLESFPGPVALILRQTGTLSSAVSQAWLTQPKRVYVAGLFGCTSVVIISEAGVWLSHHWEAPSFEGSDAQFQAQVINAIKNGDGVNMPSPFPLAADGQILNPANNVQIFISTPKDPKTGAFLFADRVGQIESTLTGQGSPFQGITVTKRGYLKPISETQQNQFQKRANSKVLIEYDNNQEAEPDETPKAQQQAIYRVWLEQQMYEHEWDATDSQKAASCARTGNQKRQAGDSCSQPAFSTPGSPGTPGASPGGTSLAGQTTSTAGTVTPRPSTSTVPTTVLTSPRSTGSPVPSTGTSTGIPTRSPSPTPSPVTSPSSSITPAPICSEGNNELMGMNNSPSSWCWCGLRGPFSTISGATTSYCAFSVLPTQTITLTSQSTSVNTACTVTSTVYAPTNSPSSTTTYTYCQCGETMAGLATSTSDSTVIVGCALSTSWALQTAISTIEATTTSAAPTTTSAAPTTSSSTEPPTPTQISGNDKGSSLCKTLAGACKVAYTGYNDTWTYTQYTSYVASAGDDDIINYLFDPFAEDGCAAMFTCDDYSQGMTGKQIKDAVEYMFENDSVDECGSTYLSNGCHVTLNGCSGCKASVPCGALPAGVTYDDCYS